MENVRFKSVDCRFGSGDSHFLKKSSGKCAFWKWGLSLLFEEVSWKMLVLEVWKGEGQGKGKGRAKSLRVFFVVDCSRGVCATTCLLEGERGFTFLFVAVSLGFVFSIFIFFSVTRCATGRLLRDFFWLALTCTCQRTFAN